MTQEKGLEKRKQGRRGDTEGIVNENGNALEDPSHIRVERLENEDGYKKYINAQQVLARHLQDTLSYLLTCKVSHPEISYIYRAVDIQMDPS